MTKLQDNLSYNGLHGQTINCQFHDTGIQTLATEAEDQYNNNLPPLLQYNTSSMSHMQTSCVLCSLELNSSYQRALKSNILSQEKETKIVYINLTLNVY